MKIFYAKPCTSEGQISTMIPKITIKSPTIATKSPANQARLAVLKRRRRQEEFRRLKSVLPPSILLNNYRKMRKSLQNRKLSGGVADCRIVDRNIGTAIEELSIIQSTVQYIDYLHLMISKRLQSGSLSPDFLGQLSCSNLWPEQLRPNFSNRH